MVGLPTVPRAFESMGFNAPQSLKVKQKNKLISRSYIPFQLFFLIPLRKHHSFQIEDSLQKGEIK